MLTNVTIRPERGEDIAAISSITGEAFHGHPHSSHTEQFMVAELWRRGVLCLSLAAEWDSAVMGHIASSRKPCEAAEILQSRRMRAVIQRVLEASVTIDGEVVSKIGPGLVVLLGIEEADGTDDVAWLSGKIARMRIFSDTGGKMNQAVTDTGGEVMVVSQFTLHASTKKGNRPSFLKAAVPGISEPLYEAFCAAMEGELGKPVGRGIFGAEMKVALVNDGPVTIVIDSRARE